MAPMLLTSSVYPSAGALPTSDVPTKPRPPALFSTTNGTPSLVESACHTTRAVISVGPPAGKGTTTRIGLLGQANGVCALACNADKATKTPTSNLAARLAFISAPH